MTTRRSFGEIDQLPSGRYRARYTGPDGRRHSAGQSFTTRKLADAFLARTDAAMQAGKWVAPGTAEDPACETVDCYARRWLAERELRPRTREQYDYLLRVHVLPAFGELRLTQMAAGAVRTWMAREAPPTAKAQAYALLGSIMKQAVTDGILERTPCTVRGGGNAKTAKRPHAASTAELAELRVNLPVRYRAMVDFGAWGSLRFGEVVALRRSDVDLEAGTVRVQRGVSRTRQGLAEGPPKTDAGDRVVPLPYGVLRGIQTHLDAFVGPAPDALLFPAVEGGFLAHSTMQRWWAPARAAAGLPESFTFHDLRHTGQTKAAAAGATLPELMRRAGQVSPTAALRYLHSVDERARAVAENMML